MNNIKSKNGRFSRFLDKINIFKHIKNSLKRKYKKTNMFNVVIATLSICLLLSVSVLFGYSILNGGLVVASSKQAVDCYYLVEANCFEEYQDAVEYSAEIMQKGGAGYISYDKGFRVFVAGYLSKSEAKSVADNLNIDTAKVYELTLGSFDKTNTDMDSIIKNNIIAFKYSIENLNNVLINYSKGEIDEEKVKDYVMLVNEEIEQQIDNFNSNFYQSDDMYKYKSYLVEFKDCFSTILKLDCTSTEFSSLARYQELTAMFCLKKMLNIV